MTQKRRVHLGIDYGTSASKIVFRDYGAPGGERAFVVLRRGSFRIPSRVCFTATEIWFGDDTHTDEDSDVYESVKMQVAAQVSGKPQYFFGRVRELPEGISLTELSILTVWFLISEGHRAVESYLGGAMQEANLGMTMGVPMAFFRDSQLRTTFLSIAKRAWTLYRSEGPLDPILPIDKAHKLLEQNRSLIVASTPEYEVRDWVRSEGEAAMWWPFQSPSIGAGPYAKVDIGAGTTHASLYRIYGNVQTPKIGLAFLGAATEPVGMDAVDAVISESEGLDGDCLSLRGLEHTILETSARARGATLPVQELIREAYRKAWIETFRKINESVAELAAWREHRLFVIGGGSLVPILVDAMRMHPAGGDSKVRLATLEQPSDLLQVDGSNVADRDLPFVGVAYGLSNIGLSIPEAFTPDQVPPMLDWTERRERLDRDDIYAK
jgi:hypothetical protein